MIPVPTLHTFLLFLLALAIGFSPSFSAGTLRDGRIIEIRAEDILLVIFGLVWLGNFLFSQRTKVVQQPLLGPIFVWLSISFFSVLINLIVQHIELSRSFFFFLKEIEFFFLYFYVFYHVESMSTAKFLLLTWIGIGFIHAVWILFQTITGFQITYYYGPTAFIEPEAPLPSAGFFLLIFVFLLQIFLYYYWHLPMRMLRKLFSGGIGASPVVGVLSAGSRTAFGALAFAFTATFLLYLLKRRNRLGAIFITLGAAIVFGGILYVLVSEASNLSERFFSIKSIVDAELDPHNPTTRLNVWKTQFEEALKHPLFLIFGFGKSVILGPFGETHNQYFKNFFETGIVGSIAFFSLILAIIRTSFHEFAAQQDGLVIGVSGGMLIATFAMLFMSLFADVFLVVKIAEVYWFFIGLGMATIFCSKKK